MTTRELTTAGDVIDALGGNKATALMAGRGRVTQHVTNWRRAGRLPADTFLIFSRALRERGLSAPPELWGIATAVEGVGEVQSS